MRARYRISVTVICTVLCWILLAEAQAQQKKEPVRLFNSAKQKLKEGKQIVGATVRRSTS